MIKKVLVVLAAAVAIAALIVALRTPNEAVTPANAAEVATTQAAPVVPPQPVVTAAPTATPVVTAAPTLTAMPEAEIPPDHFAKREEIEDAAAKGDLTALPGLLKTDLTQNGYVAAAAIEAVGKLAAVAPEKEKREAVQTLGKWLHQETKRKTNDALGNVSIIVDALQDSKSKDAIEPLVAALDSTAQPLHVETRLVEALIALSASSAKPSIERWAGRVKVMQPQDEFQKELVAEALTTADTALKSL